MKGRPIFQKSATISCMVLIVLTSGCISFLDSFRYGHYEIDFNRYYTTDGEREAIDRAENINYSAYMNISRFEGPWANYIDTEVISHFNESYFTEKEDGRRADVTYEYSAWAYHYDELDVSVSQDKWELLISVQGGPSPVSVNVSDYYISFDDSAIGYQYNGTWSLAKETGDPILKPGSHPTMYLEDAYYVEMHLDYDDIWGSLAAIYIHTMQVVVLDGDFNVMMIVLSPSSHIVS